jgi:ribonuclease HII
MARRTDARDRQICGLDEAGRGPFAGPLVAAAVAFPPGFVFPQAFPDLAFGDSKKLSPLQREVVVAHILASAASVAIEVVSVEDINANGLGWANRAAFERLIMTVDADHYIVDGRMKLNNLGRRAARVESRVRADTHEQAVSAASIVAKVHRDRIMEGLHPAFPIYGWDHNKGYGTPEHIAALRAYGPCEHHRKQFVATALARFAPQLPGFQEG